MLIMKKIFKQDAQLTFRSNRASWRKISGRRGCPPPTILLLRKLG